MSTRTRIGRTVLLTLSTIALTIPFAGRATAMELIPSLGMTKSTDTNAGNAKAFGGLALRASLTPLFKIEGGIAYRQDTMGGGVIKIRQWPVTASLWAVPLHGVYVGGGVGWYRTTIHFDSELPLDDMTSSKLGEHLGGGLVIPIAPKLGLDLGGRYVFMSKDKNFDAPTKFNPDFWTVTAGLAVSL